MSLIKHGIYIIIGTIITYNADGGEQSRYVHNNGTSNLPDDKLFIIKNIKLEEFNSVYIELLDEEDNLSKWSLDSNGFFTWFHV